MRRPGGHDATVGLAFADAAATQHDVRVTAAARELDAVGPVLRRRTFLRLTGIAVGLGLSPTGCGGVPETLAPARPLAVLTPRTYAVFTAAAMRLVGPAGTALIGDRTVDVGSLADAWLGRTPALAAPLGHGLVLLEFGVWPLVGKLRPFTSLDGAGQDAVLAECMTSRSDTKRALFRGVRSLAMLTFYGAPATRALTRFPGPFGDGTVTIADAMRD